MVPKSVLTPEALIFLLTLIEENSQLTIQDLVNQLKEKLGIDISVSSLDRALAKMEITWKNVLPIPVSWNTPEVLKSRAEFVAQNLLPFSTKNYIYVDETGFNLRIKKSKGWALSGHPATLSVLPKGKNNLY